MGRVKRLPDATDIFSSNCGYIWGLSSKIGFIFENIVFNIMSNFKLQQQTVKTKLVLHRNGKSKVWGSQEIYKPTFVGYFSSINFGHLPFKSSQI